MSDQELIDLDSLDFGDDQTWLYRSPEDVGDWLDVRDISLLDLPIYDDEEEYQKLKMEITLAIDEGLKQQPVSLPDRHIFDSRTFVKPKKKRPGFQHILEGNSAFSSLNNNKYLTYNKYTNPGMLARLNALVENKDITTTRESLAKRMSALDEDMKIQLEELEVDSTSTASDDQSPHPPSKPININLSEPAYHILNSFNRRVLRSNLSSMNSEHGGESLMRVSPPSLVSSLLMDGSGNFESETTVHAKDSGLAPGRGSMDPMASSMSMSIMDEKDMCTSFFSQPTDTEDSFLDSLPPSLVSSANSSYVVPRMRDSTDSTSLFPSATFTRLEQSEKLLSARPRHQMYNSPKKDMPMRMSESYTKTREEACQIDTSKVLNENSAKESKPKSDMTETITLHYSNNKFRKNTSAEKENLQDSFEKSDAFYNDMEEKVPGVERNSLNVTMNKQELNEIIQARQKLSLARQGLPIDPERLANQLLPNQVEPPSRPPAQPAASPRRSVERTELPAQRIPHSNGFEHQEPSPRDQLKRNSTFSKPSNSPKGSNLDTKVVYVKDENNIIDINSATLNLIDSMERNLMQEKWGSQEQAMVGSGESTDTPPCSSPSPPRSVPDTAARAARPELTSTPFIMKGKPELTPSTISPIYNNIMVDEKSYTVTRTATEVFDPNATVINSATLVKRSRRDLPNGRVSPVKSGVRQPGVPSSASYSVIPPPASVANTGAIRKTGLPASKLRQYSSHRELRIPVSNVAMVAPSGGALRPARGMARRGVYASNPALCPTPGPAPAPAPHPPPPRLNSYTIASKPQKDENIFVKPVVPNPPVLIRQGTETLRRERPQSQLVQPKDLRSMAPCGVPVSVRSQAMSPVPRPQSAAAPRTSRPASAYAQKHPTVPAERPASSTEPRSSNLPRPSRLPAPRRFIRPPSVYSVAPASDDRY